MSRSTSGLVPTAARTACQTSVSGAPWARTRLGHRAGVQRRQSRGRQQAGDDRQSRGFQRFLGVTDERGDDGGNPFGRIEDNRPIAVPDSHPALHFQCHQRLRERRPADAQFDGQFSFRWQPIARGQPLGLDEIGDVDGELLVEPRPGKARSSGLATDK